MTAERARCNARLRKRPPGLPMIENGLWGGEGYCKKAVNVGRCRMHGGHSPIKHGLYSRYKDTHPTLKGIIDGLLDDPEPLNMIEELRVARACLAYFLEHSTQPGEAESVALLGYADTVIDLVGKITAIVKRIEDVEAANAISRTDMMRAMQEMARVVAVHVTDEETLENIKKAWLQIRV